MAGSLIFGPGYLDRRLTRSASGLVPLLVAPPNHDVRIAVKANTAGASVAGGMIGHLAKIQ